MLADLLIEQAAAQPEIAPLQAIASWLPRAQWRILTSDDLARIDSYVGDGESLHDMLPAILPLAGPVWYEADVTAQHGTRMILGYGGTPAGTGEIDIWFAASAVGSDRIIGPLGPMRMDSQSVALDIGDDETGRNLRTAAGIVVRALLLLDREPPNTMNYMMLALVGHALYGAQWQSALGRDLDVSDRTVRRWVAGRTNMPAGLRGELLRIAQDRVATIEALIKSLRQMG